MRRLTSLYQPFTFDFNNSISLAASLMQLKRNRVADVMKVLKSWCNGWATSYRYHEDIKLPCLFGCVNCADSMHHYMQCPHLFALCKYLCPSTSEDPLIRWGLRNCSSETYKQIACMYSGYHAVRRHFKNSGVSFIHNMMNIDGASLRTSWTVFVEAFCAEARELNVHTVKFSVATFLHFLSTGTCPNSSIERPFEMGGLLPCRLQQAPD